MEVIVLGMGCAKCQSTVAMIERVAKEAGVRVDLTKIEDRAEILRRGVTATPAVIVDGVIVHSGGIPPHEKVAAWLKAAPLSLLNHPTRHLFFTGKGGVGKTSISTAVALYLADSGKRVLLVSTDAASNLDEMLGIELKNSPVPVPHAPNLWVLNIDPGNAAESYRQRVVDQMAADSSDTELATVREQLSGACTTEIASFDEFAALLSDDDPRYDHIVFDTAPTGHTLRLLSLPKAWSGFLAGNDRGASCLGPHSGLKMQEVRFKAALHALSDPDKTTVVLVMRPDAGAIAEASRTSEDLHALGLHNQRMVVNGVFHASDPLDTIAHSIEKLGMQAIAEIPVNLLKLPQDYVALRSFDTVVWRHCVLCWAQRNRLARCQSPCQHKRNATELDWRPFWTRWPLLNTV
jgi:arsenite-transporting ATPase